MKRMVLVPLMLMLSVLCVGTAVADGWSRVNDEVEIDYQTYELRVFVTGKDHGQMCAYARKAVFEYVSTLTIGEDRKKLADVFKVRKVMSNKVQASISKVADSLRDSAKLDSGEKTGNLYYNLKHLQPLFPDINLPTPGDE